MAVTITTLTTAPWFLRLVVIINAVAIAAAAARAALAGHLVLAGWVGAIALGVAALSTRLPAILGWLRRTHTTVHTFRAIAAQTRTLDAQHRSEVIDR